MKLLTFLGTTKYQTTTYVWRTHQCDTHLFPEALVRWFQPQDIVIFLTAEARASENWAHLQKRLAGQVVTPVDIPSGRSEAELWEILSRLTDNVADSDEVVFDITYAFRSLPILALLATAYVRSVRSVRLRHLLYGAFEAKDPASNQTPVFDLTPFVTLLDWVTAAHAFRRAGEAAGLATLLREAHQAPWRTGGHADRDHFPKHLRPLGDSLGKLADCLALVRPADANSEAATLAGRLRAAEVEVDRWARPFALLLDHTAEVCQELTAEDELEAHRRQIDWHVRHRNAVQAVTLAREWLVSWAARAVGSEALAERVAVEKGLGYGAAALGGRAEGDPPALAAPIQALPQGSEALQLWGELSGLRNDLAHCGFNPSPAKPGTIWQRVEELPARLGRFPLQPASA